eukprot:2532445-Amphidinium_carterae.1
MRDQVDHQGLVFGAMCVKRDILETQLAPPPSWRSVTSVLMSTCATITASGWHVWDPDQPSSSAAGEFQAHVSGFPKR